MHHHHAEPLFQPMSPLKDLAFDPISSTMDDFGIYMESNLPFDLNRESALEMENSGVIQHDYVAGLISDLDDCTLFPEYTDIR